MPDFKYVAKDNKGKTVTGKRSVSSQKELVIELERKNLTIVSIEEAGREEKSFKEMMTDIMPGAGRVSTFELAIFCRQMATMLHGGVPILNAISSIADEMKNPGFKKILQGIGQDLRGGTSVAESFKKHPEAFSILFTSILEAGEKVGALDKMLERLSHYLESRDRLVKKIRSATTYPTFIAGFFVFAIGVITVFLIPRFQKIYEGFGAELPALTRIVFNTSNFFIKNMPIVIFVLVAGIFSLFLFMRHSKKGRIMFDSALLKIPVLGDVIKKAAISKFCRTLSTLLSEGISVTEALVLVGRTSGNIVIENASNNSSKAIVGGETIPIAFNKAGVFPSLMLQMVSIGVDSGSLPELLDKTADFYEDQVDVFISTMTTMIEPILVVSLGAVIAFVVVALYMPIFSLSTAMGAR
jgi:type IV pilus assembly protein PilC